MLLIDCPHCGPRDEVEFHYGGQAHVAYPEDPYALTDAQWAEFLFYRDNPRGPFAERWQHGVGCRKWFNAIRDTASYEFLEVYPMGAQPPHEYAHLVSGSPTVAPAEPASPGASPTGPASPGAATSGPASPGASPAGPAPSSPGASPAGPAPSSPGASPAGPAPSSPSASSTESGSDSA